MQTTFVRSLFLAFSAWSLGCCPCEQNARAATPAPASSAPLYTIRYAAPRYAPPPGTVRYQAPPTFYPPPEAVRYPSPASNRVTLTAVPDTAPVQPPPRPTVVRQVVAYPVPYYVQSPPAYYPVAYPQPVYYRYRPAPMVHFGGGFFLGQAWRSHAYHHHGWGGHHHHHHH